MKRISTALTLLMALAAMSKTPEIVPMPAACDVLASIKLAATLGADAAYVPGMQNETEHARMSLCTAQTPDLASRMTLMLRESLSAEAQDIATLRRQAIEGLRDTIGAEVAVEEVDIGDAAIWVGEISQLTVWHRGGRVMLIFSPTPTQDRAAAEAAARAVLAAYP